MHARVTHYKMKPDSIAEAKSLVEDLKEQIMALGGMKQFINSVNDDGSGVIVSLVESKEISDANKEDVANIWANFAEYLTEPPSPAGYEVFADWKN